MTTQTKDSFLRIYRKTLESVKLNNIVIDEFALYVWLSLKANPFNGWLVTSFSELASEWGMKPARIRYLCEQLASKKYIRYEIGQGQRAGRFYIYGLVLPSDEITSEELRKKDPQNSEVAIQFPKSENVSNHDKSSESKEQT